MAWLNIYSEITIFLIVFYITEVIKYKFAQKDEVMLKGNKLFLIDGFLRRFILLGLVFFFIYQEGFTAIGLNLEIDLFVVIISVLVGLGTWFLLTVGLGSMFAAIEQKKLTEDELEKLKEKRTRISSNMVPEKLSSFILFLLAILFLGAISEEIVFRGYLLNRFDIIVGLPLAILFQALIFGFSHFMQKWSGVILTAISAVIFALLYLWFGTILAPMIAHAVGNTVSFIIAYIQLKKNRIKSDSSVPSR